MRTLSASLLAAQKNASATPYFKVVISDRIGGVRRLPFSRLYSGDEPDGHHAASMTGDGSLLRARVSGGRLYYQQVANPGGGSDFSSWTDLEAAATAGLALCAQGSRALLFYMDSDGLTLKLRESADSGVTLGSPTTVATASGTVGWLAAGVKSNGDTLLVYSTGAMVYKLKRSGGNWGSASAWSNDVASVSGLACYYQGDYNIVITGADALGNAFVWTCIYGDGFSQAPNTWSPLREVTRASSGSSVSFHAPFLAQPDTYRLTFIEKYTGAQAYSRPYLSYSPPTTDYATNLWREPVPFNLASGYGLALAFSATTAWLSAPSGVWSAALSPESLDVSADVIEAATDDRPFDGRLRLVLRNDGGRYSLLPSVIKLGAEVAISPGYLTSNGAESSDGLAYWIDSIERHSIPGQAYLVLTARDSWSLLGAWRARRQYTWATGQKNLFGLLQFLFARAGLEFSSAGGSAAASNRYPSFTVNPGESGLNVVRRLLDALADVIFLKAYFGYLKEPLSSDPSNYAYGTDHAILRGSYTGLAPAVNRVQVFGQGIFAEGFDWPGVEDVYDRLKQEHDANLTSLAQAEDRAAAALRREAVAALSGEIAVPVNCGQELYDVIEVTDSGAGLTSARRRVLGIAIRYATGAQPAYEQGLTLGGV